jgi:hypothetical protein
MDPRLADSRSPRRKISLHPGDCAQGRVLRKIDGDPFVWQWIFWDNGRQVAYESGPLHFGLQCTLVNVRTGKKLASYDCFHGVPSDAPDWLKALEKAH